MGCPSQSCREIVPLIPLTSVSGSRCTAAAYPERSRSTARCWRSPRHSGLTALPCKTSNTEGLGLFGFWGIVSIFLSCCNAVLSSSKLEGQMPTLCSISQGTTATRPPSFPGDLSYVCQEPCLLAACGSSAARAAQVNCLNEETRTRGFC